MLETAQINIAPRNAWAKAAKWRAKLPEENGE